MKIEHLNTLQNICEVKFAVVIANHKDIKKKILFSELSESSESFREWKHVLDPIINKILKPFPSGVLKRIPKFLIIYVAIQMWRWATFHHSNFYLPWKFFNDFFNVSLFTSKGRINEEKAIRKLIKEASISSFLQYKIACHYYLDDIIPVLFQEVRHDRKFNKFLKMQNENDAIVMWSEYLEEKEKINSASLLVSAKESFLANAFPVSFGEENVAGIKYCWREMTPSKRILDSIQHQKAQHRGDTYISVHEYPWLVKLQFYEQCSYYDQLLSFSEGYEQIIDILEFFFLELKNGECKEFLFMNNALHEMLYYILRWPFQHLFLCAADYTFDIVRDEGELFQQAFSGRDYFSILHNIIDLSRNPDFCGTYDYPFLFKEFWNRSPACLKNEIIGIESEHIKCPTIKPSGTPCRLFISKFLLEKLILHSNVSSDDERNFQLILEYASLEDKGHIFRTKGKNICQKLISNENIRLANLFLEILNLDEETLITFKKSLKLFVFQEVLKKESIALAEQFVKWVVKSDDIDNFKKEIFSEIFEFPKIIDLILNRQVSFSFLNQIYSWFFQTKEEFEHWKSNVIFDQDFAETFVEMTEACSRMLDVFFKFLGYSIGTVQDVKRDILLKAMPYIIIKLVEQYSSCKDYDSSLENRILYLCLYNQQRINEFTNFFHTFCKDYAELKMCLICRNSNNVYEKIFHIRRGKNVFQKESKLYCKVHDIKIMLPEDVNKLCSSVTSKLTTLMEVRKRAKKSLKTRSHHEDDLCQELCNLEIVDHCDNCEH